VAAGNNDNPSFLISLGAHRSRTTLVASQFQGIISDTMSACCSLAKAAVSTSALGDGINIRQ